MLTMTVLACCCGLSLVCWHVNIFWKFNLIQRVTPVIRIHLLGMLMTGQICIVNPSNCWDISVWNLPFYKLSTWITCMPWKYHFIIQPVYAWWCGECYVTVNTNNNCYCNISRDPIVICQMGCMIGWKNWVYCILNFL